MRQAHSCVSALARDLTARVRLSNLADGFIPDPAAEFPVGRLVRGRVLSVDSNRRVPFLGF